MEPNDRNQPPISILYVEDDDFAREITCRLISLGYPDFIIHQAENGLVGLELFKKQKPDIVISDINMPVMNGIQMAKEIRSISPHACIIVVSAHSDKKYLDDVIGLGNACCVPKPIDKQRLFEAIEGYSVSLCREQQG